MIKDSHLIERVEYLISEAYSFIIIIILSYFTINFFIIFI